MLINKKSLLTTASVFALSALSAPAFATTAVTGFVNAEYDQFNIGNKSANPDQRPPYGGFDLQRVGIDFEHDQDIFTTIAQLQFEHGPQVNNAGDGTGTNASFGDGFGEISLERAWIQARFDKAFHLRFGKEQTPTLWERAHYPVIYTSITQPQIEENVFEEYLIGLLADGELPYGFVYNLWLSKANNTFNTSATGSQQVTNGDELPPTAGFRFGWQTEVRGSYAIYLAALGASYHDYLHSDTVANSTVWGIEGSLKWQGATLWFEDSNSASTRGWYVLPSYTFELPHDMELSPYVLYDVFNDDSVGPESRKVFAGGLNFKPNSYMTIKGEGVWTQASNGELANQAVRFGVIYSFN